VTNKKLDITSFKMQLRFAARQKSQGLLGFMEGLIISNDRK
jgi:hypothetical protein